MVIDKPVFAVRRLVGGVYSYSSGGSNPSWTECPKTWRTPEDLVSHLRLPAQILGWRANRWGWAPAVAHEEQATALPEDWEVVRFSVSTGIVQQWSAREFLARRGKVELVEVPRAD